MNYNQLVNIIKERKSFLCVGLDTDPAKIPAGMSILEFNKAIIDATRPFCVAYKPNIAFYECLGKEGWDILEETVDYIGKDHFTIADGKRGDIGNTSNYYAKTFFETYGFNSVTVAPYMGKDSVEPFLQHPGKWAIVLALTSNPGSMDFQMLQVGDERVFEKVLRTVSSWGSIDNTMFVVGATRAEMLADIRKIIPQHFLLVPGVGAQGGSLEEVVKYGMTNDCGLLVNASRSILYASAGADFATAAANEAKAMQQQMAEFL